MKGETKMDAKKLIAEVHKRPVLWNQKHILYHNRDSANRVWTELATLLKVPKTYLKAKWKGLRDTFRCELKKEMMCRRDKSIRLRTSWVHYKSLLFLKDQMAPRPPIWERRRNQEITEKSSEDFSIKEIQKITQLENNRLNDINTTINNNTSNKRRKIVVKTNEINKNTNLNAESSTSSSPSPPIDEINDENNLHNVYIKEESEDISGAFDETFTENSEFNEKSSDPIDDNAQKNISSIQNLSLNSLNNENCNGEFLIDPIASTNYCDDNYHFLMSLLPHIKKLSDEKRMLMRIQIQELVYNEVYKKNY